MKAHGRPSQFKFLEVSSHAIALSTGRAELILIPL